MAFATDVNSWRDASQHVGHTLQCKVIGFMAVALRTTMAENFEHSPVSRLHDGLELLGAFPDAFRPTARQRQCSGTLAKL